VTKLRALTMPKWGIEMVEGTISEWNVKEGEQVAKGRTVVLIETDKIVNEIEAEIDARFARIVAAPGSTLAVGALLAVMAEGEASPAEIDAFVASFNGAAASGAAASGAAASGASSPGQSAHGAKAPGESAPGAPLSERVPAGEVLEAAPPGEPAGGPGPGRLDLSISPAAWRFAQQSGLDLRRVAGSGRKGRITFQDAVQASRPARVVGGGSPVSVLPTTQSVAGFYASPAAARLAVARGVDLGKVRGTGPRGRISRRDIAPAVKVTRMSPMRKAIARQLSLSKSTVPHFYVRADAKLDALIQLRARLKLSSDSVPGLNAYLIRATSLALMEVPEVNIQVHGDEIHQFANADIAVAVATNKGLITPVLRAAETKTVRQVSAELSPLIERARAGALKAHEIEGGSFSVSNLGMFGVEQFDAIINIPQGAILAVGTVRRVCVERDSGLEFASVVALSLSCDHRAIDGAVGGRFLTVLRRHIESPELL
jgi:pyruvate dehydrogenase E2 component (dihydrolipoamide acetyltransferase)